MKKKIKYPKDFRYYSTPYCSVHPPQRTIFSETIESKKVNLSGNYSGCDIPSGCNYLDIEVNLDSDGVDDIELTFSHKEEIPNPKYQEELKKYEKAKEKFESDLENWKYWKMIYDEEQKELKEKKEKENYKRLKKKFEKEEIDKELGENS